MALDAEELRHEVVEILYERGCYINGENEQQLGAVIMAIVADPASDEDPISPEIDVPIPVTPTAQQPPQHIEFRYDDTGIGVYIDRDKWQYYQYGRDLVGFLLQFCTRIIPATRLYHGGFEEDQRERDFC